MNEESFRLYAIWTFAFSSIHTIIYLGFFLGQYRTPFFIFLGIIAAIILLYWFRDGGNKFGWQSLDESLLITLFISLITCILMCIAAVLAGKNVSYSPDVFKELHTAATFIFQISPIVLIILNVVNLLIFIARN